MKKTITSVLTIVFALYFLTLFSTNSKSNISVVDHYSYKDDQQLNTLVEGNKRFYEEKSIHQNISKKKIIELSKEQTPFAVIVSCSDSRVSPEIIFNQGLGDLFVVRTAGNVIGDYEIGSIEYAVEHLNCKLIVVLGHLECGAVKAFLCSHTEENNDHISRIIDFIASNPKVKALSNKDKNNLSDVITANVMGDVKILKNCKPILNKLVNNKEIEIIGAIYDIKTGKVKFINE